MDDARAGPGRSRLPSPARATKVVGSFEHPILPMPPVSSEFQKQIFRDGVLKFL